LGFENHQKKMKGKTKKGEKEAIKKLRDDLYGNSVWSSSINQGASPEGKKKKRGK